MRVAPVEQRRKKYLILPRWTGAAGSPLCYCYWHVCDSHIYATRETERFPIFPKDPASKTPLPEFSGLRMRDGHNYATHLGASLLAPPLPFEINLGPPKVGCE